MTDPVGEIIKRCQHGDQQAFKWLLQEYGPRLYRYYVRLSGSATDAEDLLQDLFVKLLDKIRAYHHEGKFEHWLFRVAANLARDRIRKLSNSAPLDRNSSLEFDRLSVIPSSDLNPAEQLQRNELGDKLQWALNKLSSQEREIIILRHYSQLSFKEIAEQFDMPLGTALAKVHRGLKKLKEIMKDYETINT